MFDLEQQLAGKIKKARSSADKFDSASKTNTWVSYLGAIGLVLVGVLSSWNWIIIGYAGNAALVIWFVSSFAKLQTAKMELAVAVAEAESAHRAKAKG